MTLKREAEHTKPLKARHRLEVSSSHAYRGPGGYPVKVHCSLKIQQAPGFYSSF